jgi:hypothetical protein
MASPEAHPADLIAPFFYDRQLTDQLPLLNLQDISDLSAVLRSLATGRAPRIGAVTKALNAYNITQTPVDGKRAWAYFHAVTNIPPVEERLRWTPHIELNDNVLEDLFVPWRSIKPDANQGVQSTQAARSASYRFVCFIHKHRFGPKTGKWQNVYTISIWDREVSADLLALWPTILYQLEANKPNQWDEMTWHDTYPRGRRDRRDAIRRFWQVVDIPMCEFTHPRAEFMEKIRYRTAYHACGNLEAAARENIDPSVTLWAIMSIGLQHINDGGRDGQVSIIPDRLEIFGGTAPELLPCWFARLLCLCLHAPRETDEDDWDPETGGLRSEEDMKEFVEKFRMAIKSERMGWMKTRGRVQLDALMNEPGGAWLGNFPWLLETLRMARP